MSGPLRRSSITPRPTIRDGNVAAIPKKFLADGGGAANTEAILRLILDVGFGTVVAGGGLDVPLAVGGLVFDRLGATRHPLLGGGALGRRQRRRVGRERFPENTPSTV